MFGQSVFFPSAFKSSEISAGVDCLAEAILPMRARTDSQTRQSQRSIHWRQESFLLLKCKAFTHSGSLEPIDARCIILTVVPLNMKILF